MSTDTAVIVTKMIVAGKRLEEMQFQDGITIQTGEGEEVILPYQYLAVDGKPMLAPGLREMLKEQNIF